MLLVSPNLVRSHEVTYIMPNGTVMDSSGSIELNVVINFDEITKDYEILNNLRFDLVENLHNPNVDCIISGDDITQHQILVRIPKINELPITTSEPRTIERIIADVPIGKRNYYLSAITRSEGTRRHISVV